MRTASIFLFLLITSCHFGFTQKRPMSIDDGLNMIQLRGAKISPKGNKIIYGKSVLNWKDNKRETSYYSVESDATDEYKYLSGKSDSDIQFSLDGKYLSLKRSIDKKSQIHIMRIQGGEPVVLTKHENGIGSYRWAPDSKSIFFSSNEVLSKEAQKSKKDGYDHVFVDEGPNGQRKSEWTHIYQINLEEKKIKAVLKEDFKIGQFEIRPDGSAIAYTRRNENRRNQGYLSELYLFNLKDSSHVRLTENASPERSIRWSPDGTRLSFMSADDEKWELKNSKIWILDIETKEIKLLSKSFEGNIRGYYWSTDGTAIWFSGLQKTNSNIFKLNVENGELTNVSNREGSWSLLDMTQDRSAALFSFSDFDTPTDLYYSKLPEFNPIKLTNLNPVITDSIRLATMEIVNWESADGLPIEGLVYKPLEHSASSTDPFLLHIHGGPAGVFTNSFNYRYHVWSGLGYVQLAPNVGGSSGYSDAFLRGNMKDIGGKDYDDLMTGVDRLLEKKYMDPNKMAVRGWSYGGILGGTVVTKTGRFKAASLGAMVSDWTSEYGIGFNYDVRLWYIGGTPWENPEAYRRISPLTHSSNVTTPVLLMHGDRDYTDTEAQSMMFFAALKDQGKEVKYIKFPREPHGFREPRHIRTRDLEEIKWIQKYTLDLDWNPWERKEDKKKEKVKKKERT